jgi:hypothetical protein
MIPAQPGPGLPDGDELLDPPLDVVLGEESTFEVCGVAADKLRDGRP